MKSAEELKKFKRGMIAKPTRAERIFKEKLEELGVEFKQQLICGFYILDFVIPDKMLCFEIDGAIHDDRARYDYARDNFLRSTGFNVIRIRNEDVAHYDLSIIEKYPTKPPAIFRSALAHGNVARSNSIRNERKEIKRITDETREREMNKLRIARRGWA